MVGAKLRVENVALVNRDGNVALTVQAGLIGMSTAEVSTRR